MQHEDFLLALQVNEEQYQKVGVKSQFMYFNALVNDTLIHIIRKNVKISSVKVILSLFTVVNYCIKQTVPALKSD